MAVLRRPHDHCRGLYARQRTARSPVLRPRNRNTMRVATTSLRHPLAGALRSRRRATVIPATANSHATPRAVPKSRCRAQRRRSIRDRQRQFALNDAGQRLPPKPLPNQIPIDREPLTSPRGFLLRRLSDAGPRHGCTDRRPAGIRNPSRKPAVQRSRLQLKCNQSSQSG